MRREVRKTRHESADGDDFPERVIDLAAATAFCRGAGLAATQ